MGYPTDEEMLRAVHTPPPSKQPTDPAIPIIVDRPHRLAWNGKEWVDERCGCRYHPDDDNGTHGGAPHVHHCEHHAAAAAKPVPMLLVCPICTVRHVDKGEFATKPHHTHACQSCGHVWRPAIGPTVGVQFLPGFKDEP